MHFFVAFFFIALFSCCTFSHVASCCNCFMSHFIVIAVRKRVPAPPFLRHSSFDTARPPFLNFLLFLSYFPFYSILRYFRQFTPPSRTPLLSRSDQPTFPGLKRYQKYIFTSSTVAFYQKSIFNLLNLVTNSLSYFMGHFQAPFYTT